MRVMRIMRIMRVAVGAPMSNHHPNGKSSPEPFQTAALQTHGYTEAHPSCQTGQTGQTGQTQAPRHRNTHTTAAIKLPCITLTVNFRPSQTTQRHANPRGITWRPHHHFISLISLIGLMQAPRHRNTQTAVAIKKALHIPAINLPVALPLR